MICKSFELRINTFVSAVQKSSNIGKRLLSLSVNSWLALVPGKDVTVLVPNWATFSTLRSVKWFSAKKYIKLYIVHTKCLKS